MDSKLRKGTRVPKPTPTPSSGEPIRQSEQKLHDAVFTAQVTHGDGESWKTTLKVSPILQMHGNTKRMALEAAETLVQKMRQELKMLPLITPEQTNEPDYQYAAEPLLRFALQIGAMAYEPTKAGEVLDELRRMGTKAVDEWDRRRARKPSNELQTSAEKCQQLTDERRQMYSDKRFHRSDSLTYEYSVIGYYKPMFGSYAYKPMSGPQPDVNNIRRESVKVYAGPSVHWSMIANEVKSYRQDLSAKNPFLATCIVDYPEFAVALTYNGFIKILESMPTYGMADYDEMIDTVAKTLVQMRDYHRAVAGSRVGDHIAPFNAFYPKD